MKKNLLLFTAILFYSGGVFCQALYKSNIEIPSRFNPSLGMSGTPVKVFDDVLIPASLVAGTDSIRITKVNFGIRRIANAPAISVNFYYTWVDDTATTYPNFIKIPPVSLGTINLPPSVDTSVTTIVSLGDSIKTLFSIKTDTGNLYTGFQTLFLGLSFSLDTTGLNGWRFTQPGTPDGDNDDVIWLDDVDKAQRRSARFFGGSPSATFYLEVFGGGSNVLPVTLNEFTAHRFGRVNMLKWSTSEEINTSHFIIERSGDGTNYSPLSNVSAAGNSSVVHNYSFTDLTPMKGNNYYRLRMVDKNNGSKYSLVRTIVNTGFSDISIYPNPVKNNLAVTINADNPGHAHMVISDITGKIILNRTIAVTKGNNLLPVNTTNMASGAYLLKIKLDNEPVILKFTKE